MSSCALSQGKRELNIKKKLMGKMSLQERGGGGQKKIFFFGIKKKINK
jgi:hypothetical protein